MFSVHQNTLFFSSRPFGFSTCRVYKFYFTYIPNFSRTFFGSLGCPYFFPRPVNLAGLCSCIVFSEYVHVHRVWRIIIVHHLGQSSQDSRNLSKMPNRHGQISIWITWGNWAWIPATNHVRWDKHLLEAWQHLLLWTVTILCIRWTWT